MAYLVGRRRLRVTIYVALVVGLTFAAMYAPVVR